WSARLAEHIGAFTVEPVRSRAHLLADRLALAGLTSVCALLSVTLPERDPHEALWLATGALLDRLGAPGWQAEYLPWEMRLLEDLGCALDRPSCAVTGAREGLACVRPKPGRAGCRAGAGDWAEKLFPLPEGMAGGPMTPAALLQG